VFCLVHEGLAGVVIVFQQLFVELEDVSVLDELGHIY